MVKSVWFGRHGQMGWVSRQDQEVAETAKRLILNGIICHNYLHLSQLISKLSDREERRAFVKRLSKLSVLTHHHINFNGIYDFPEDAKGTAGVFDWREIEHLEL